MFISTNIGRYCILRDYSIGRVVDRAMRVADQGIKYPIKSQ